MRKRSPQSVSRSLDDDNEGVLKREEEKEEGIKWELEYPSTKRGSLYRMLWTKEKKMITLTKSVEWRLEVSTDRFSPLLADQIRNRAIWE